MHSHNYYAINIPGVERPHMGKLGEANAGCLKEWAWWSEEILEEEEGERLTLTQHMQHLLSTWLSSHWVTVIMLINYVLVVFLTDFRPQNLCID